MAAIKPDENIDGLLISHKQIPKQGGGSGGAVREAGGAFGKMEAAHEELYFKKLEREQFVKLRKHLEDEVDYHKDSIKDHEEAIERHKKKIQKLHHQEKDITQPKE